VGGGRDYGRVEIGSDGVRGTVCDWDWDKNSADVVCRQINPFYTQGEVYV